jgi:hypothetical protein
MKKGGYIYLITDSNGLFKIGMTRSISERRLKQLQTGNGNELRIVHTFHTEYPFRLETLLHRIYEQKCVLNEWYMLTPDEVIDFINVCQKEDDIIQVLKDNYHFSKNLR